MDYVAELRKLAVHCEFGTEIHNNPRNQLVCGGNNQTMQRKMLAGQTLNLTEAVSMAKSKEATCSHLK